MEQIRRIMRPTDVPDQGLLCDLLWSDPDKDTMGWGENDRGVSFTFGAEVSWEWKDNRWPISSPSFTLRLSRSSWPSMISIWFVARIKSSRTVTSSSRNASWWHYSRRPITAENLTTQVSNERQKLLISLSLKFEGSSYGEGEVE